MSKELFDLKYKALNKSGHSYSFGEEKLGVGREKAKQYLKDNPKLMEKIKKQIWEVIEKGLAPDEEQGKPGKKEDIEK